MDLTPAVFQAKVFIIETGPRSIKDSELSLARNEFKEVILVIQERDRKLRIPLRHDELVVHRRFAGEGKATLTVKDQGRYSMLLRVS